VIGKIIKSIFSDFQTFLVIWAVIIIVNQLFIFGACFAPYCIVAALPHTSIIAALAVYFMHEAEKEAPNTSKNTEDNYSPTSYSEPKKEDLDLDDFEDTNPPFCPKCGSKMILRTAKKGKYIGQNFWGCTTFPHCNGILNI